MITKRALLRTIEREREAYATERRLLINQILHLSGKPWTPAPSSEPAPAEYEPDAEHFQASPEQHLTV